MQVLIGLIIASVASGFILSSVAKTVYKKTGYNSLKGLPKFLMYVVGIFFLGASGYLAQSDSSALPAIMICLVLAIVLFILIHLKAGIKYAVVLAVTQVICGGLVTLISIIGFALSLFTGGKASGFGKLFTINESEMNTVRQAAMDNINCVHADAIKTKEQNNMQADAYAQKKGFVDADEAEIVGINTGKQY
jgi:hypothetical protein